MCLRARYYAPEQGRFLTRDTWAGTYTRPASLHRYTYAENNPVLYTDPSGQDPWWCDRYYEREACLANGTPIGTRAYHITIGTSIADKIVPRNVNLLIQGGYGLVEVPSTLVAGGIAVQSEWYNPIKDGRNWLTSWLGSGIGKAQISDWQMQGNILGYVTIPPFYTGCYGLKGMDQMTDDGAAWGMAVRIGLGLEVCPQCSDQAKIVIAALLQNGSGVNAQTIFDNRNGAGNFAPQNLLDVAGYGYHPGWPGWFERRTGLQYDTQYMLSLYLNELRNLHNRGWKLPYGLSLADLNEIQRKYITEKPWNPNGE